MTRVLGLVTARGGSKGFPRKNLAPLAGRPLVSWTHRLLDRFRRRHPEVVPRLSTDDPEIAAAWPEADRPRRLRPAALATDDATTIAVVLHELDLAAEEGRPCDAVLLVQPTSPLLALEDLDAAWSRFAGGCPAVVGVTPAAHPVAWSHRLGADEALVPVLSDAPPDSPPDATPPAPGDRRRQEHEPAYLPCGLYLATTAFVREHRAFLVPGVTRGIVVPPGRAVDIDVPGDLDAARAHLLRARRERPLEVQGRRVGGDAPVFVIAEAGVNHGGDPELALELVDAAAEAGATAVKFQTFRAAALATPTARKAAYQLAAAATRTETQLAMLERLELSPETFAELKARAEAAGLIFLSSPFDPGSARLLLDLGVAALKLGSGELTNHPFLAQIAEAGRPLFVSTGMATLDEVEDAAEVLVAHGDPPVAWLHCVSSYPAPPGESNLRAMESLRLAVGGPVGMSDHTLGTEVTLAAVALGAAVVEKHLTLSRDLAGPDHRASLEPHEFGRMVHSIRAVEAALGDGAKRPMASELDVREVARKSIVAARDLPAGRVLRAEDMVVRRPGTGLAPGLMDRVVGRALTRTVRCDEPLTWEDLR